MMHSNHCKLMTHLVSVPLSSPKVLIALDTGQGAASAPGAPLAGVPVRIYLSSYTLGLKQVHSRCSRCPKPGFAALRCNTCLFHGQNWMCRPHNSPLVDQCSSNRNGRLQDR